MISALITPVVAMPTWVTVILIVLAVLLVLLVILMIVGSRMQKKQLEQQEQMASMAQTVSMLIIDKKTMRMKDANLPKEVMDQVGTGARAKVMLRSKMPFVKVKIGPRIMTLIADPKVYEVLPVKKEIKAVVSGMYITEIKSVRGGSIPTPLTKEEKKRLAKEAKKAAKANK